MADPSEKHGVQPSQIVDNTSYEDMLATNEIRIKEKSAKMEWEHAFSDYGNCLLARIDPSLLLPDFRSCRCQVIEEFAGRIKSYRSGSPILAWMFTEWIQGEVDPEEKKPWAYMDKILEEMRTKAAALMKEAKLKNQQAEVEEHDFDEQVAKAISLSIADTHTPGLTLSSESHAPAGFCLQTSIAEEPDFEEQLAIAMKMSMAESHAPGLTLSPRHLSPDNMLQD